MLAKGAPCVAGAAGVRDEEYAAMMDKVVPYLDDLICADENWQPCSATDGMTIERRHSTWWAGHVFRAKITLPISHRHAAVLVHPAGPYRVKWDSILDSTRLLRTIDEATGVYENVMPSLLGGMVASRYSVDLVRFAIHADQAHQIYATSVEYAGHKLGGKHVRGWMYPSGIKIDPCELEPECKCTVTTIFQSDAKLKFVPRWVHEALVPTNIVKWFGDIEHVGANMKLDRHGHIRLMGDWAL